MLIAVTLLRVSAALWSNSIKIPEWNVDSARKLVPVVAVNIVGLVFNTLCLRDVEASFFQVRQISCKRLKNLKPLTYICRLHAALYFL
jgi:hypothetical protein